MKSRRRSKHFREENTLIIFIYLIYLFVFTLVCNAYKFIDKNVYLLNEPWQADININNQITLRRLIEFGSFAENNDRDLKWVVSVFDTFLLQHKTLLVRHKKQQFSKL